MRRSYDYDKATDTVVAGVTDPAESLCWSWYNPRNFGDWIGPYLFEAITGKVPKHCPHRPPSGQPYFLSVGSIMQFITQPDRAIVWGTGIISRSEKFQRPRAVHAVRGPRTRDRLVELGHECPKIFGDPAILLPLYFKPQRGRNARGGAVVPHFVDYGRVRSIAEPGVQVIDVTQSVEDVIEDIASHEFILSSSLHGLIVAHAYRVPAVWMASGTPLMGDAIKFLDYYASMDCEARCHEVLEFNATTLHRFSRHATCPDSSALQGGLLKACPFHPQSSPSQSFDRNRTAVLGPSAETYRIH